AATHQNQASLSSRFSKQAVVGFVQGLCIASSAEVIVRNADFFVEMDIREILIANFSLPTFVVFKDTEWLFFASQEQIQDSFCGSCKQRRQFSVSRYLGQVVTSSLSRSVTKSRLAFIDQSAGSIRCSGRATAIWDVIV